MYDEETEEFIGNVEQLSGDIADLTKTAKNSGGISLFTDETKSTYKSTYQLLKEISGVWDDLTDKQQAGLLEKLAGKRGGQVLAGILNDFSEVEKAMTEMNKAAGSADEEMKVIEESISYKLNDLKETWIGLLQEMIDRGTIDEIIDMLIKLSEAIVKVVEANPEAAFSGLIALLSIGKFGGFKSIADIISGLGGLAKGFGNLSKGAKAANDTAKALTTLGDEAKVASSGVGGLTSKLSSLLGISSAAASILLTVGTAAAAIGIGAVVWDTFTTTVEESEEELTKTSSKIEDIKGQIAELESLDSRTAAQETRLSNLNKELDLQERLYAIEEKRRNAELFGTKFSDYADPSSYASKIVSEVNLQGEKSLPNVIAQFERFDKEVETSTQKIDKWHEELNNPNSEYSEEIIGDTLSNLETKLEKAQDKREKALSDLQEKELLYTQEIADIETKLHNGNLYSEDRKQAIKDLNVYKNLLYQVQEILDENARKEGTYDYFAKDSIKELANKFSSSSGMGAVGTYDALLAKTEKFNTQEQLVWLNAIKGAKSYAEAIRLGDEAVQKLREDTDTLGNSTSHSIAIAWDLADALAKYNISQDSFDKYLAVFKELNPELAENEQLLQQAAVANMAFDQSVEDLRSHLNDYVENLETLDESNVAYAESLQSLAQDLSGLTGIDFSITDAQNFASDINNLELLRQALDGDNDALNRLRENANQMIIVRIQADAEINTDEFNAQYNELVNWIANNPDIGMLEAQSYLNASPFIQTCMELIKQGKMTAQDLQKIFANLGWNITWDTTTMKVPKLTTSGKSFTQIPTSELKKAGKYLNADGGWRYNMEEIPIPTNIHFVGKSSGTTTPKVSKPTSSSGSNYKPSQKSGGKSGGGGGKSASDKAKDDEKELEDTYDEFFDYFERRVKVLTDAISLLDAHLENVVGSAAKNKLLDAQERIYKMQQQEYADAKSMYKEMANKALAKIPDNIKNDIINGAVAIDEFIGKGNEEVVQAMQDYTKWADKIAECKQQLAELKEQLRQLELKRFKNIAQDWQDLFDLRQNNAIDLIDKQIDLFEEAGQLIGKSFYEEQKAQAQKQYELLSNERKALVDELNRGLSNGTIEIGSDEWLEMRSILSDLEGQILDCAKAIETFDNAILQLHVDVFERIQGQLDDFDDQLSDMASFLDDADVGNKYGEWSQEGMARAGLLAQQFDLANKKVHDYAEEIEWLNEQYKLGKYSTTEYMDRLADLMSEQRDAAQTADDMKDAMVELNRDRVDIVIDGINEEIKAYEELIDTQKKALQAQKDLHDYEKQVADENKAIVDIERQLAAIRNDDSAAANAKRKQLEAQLKDAQDQLSETEYDHSITAQEDALDAQMEQYRQMREAEIQSWEEYAANIEQVMIDMLAMVQANAFEIGTVITETATAHGFQISQALTDPWFTAQQTIAQYGEVLSAETSSFIASLESVEHETWNLQAQADATSVQLAQMFGNRADNLVNELQRSWESEQNLANMTHALSDAFVQALDSGYRIGEVVNPLESAKAATDALADAADSAASAFDGMADSARRAAQEAANANSMPTTASRGIPYEPPYKTHVTTLYNAPSSTVKWDRIGGYYRYYAKGLSKADKDQLAWTQELGDEVIVSPTRSSILTPIKKGDAVIDAKGTQNLFELAKVDPKQLLNGMSSASTSTLQQNKAFGVNISSLITVNGSINDSLAMMKIAANEAQTKITKTLKDLSDEIKY